MNLFSIIVLILRSTSFRILLAVRQFTGAVNSITPITESPIKNNQISSTLAPATPITDTPIKNTFIPASLIPAALIPTILIAVILHPQDAIAQETQAPQTEFTLENIFLEPYLPGTRPSFRYFTTGADSMMIAWNDSAHTDTGLYRISLANPSNDASADTLGRSAPRPVHSPDLRHIAFTRDQKLFISRVDGSENRLILASRTSLNSLSWAHDSQKLAFTREGDVWVYDLQNGSLQQVTQRSNGQPSYSIDAWAGNRYLVLRQSDFSAARTIYFPEYADEFVQPGESRRGIPDVTLLVAHLDTPRFDTLATGVHRSSVSASATGRYIALDYADAALKERKITLYQPEDSTRTVLFEDTTEGWLYDYDLAFAPEGDLLLFRSEQSGWNHLYLANPAGENPAQNVVQLTDGDYEVTWFGWTGEKEFVFASSEADYGVRHLVHAEIGSDGPENEPRAPGSTTVSYDPDTQVIFRQLTREDAYRYQFRLTPDRRSVIYAKTYFNRPYDLFKLDIRPESYQPETNSETNSDTSTNTNSVTSTNTNSVTNAEAEKQLTFSVPDNFDAIGWQQEQYVRITGRDGETELSLSVLYPEGFRKPGSDDQPKTGQQQNAQRNEQQNAQQQTYPAVVFVHGAGSLQNVFQGWSNSYWREYMFNQYLTRMGYIVLEVDYRHSTGYGRKFREDVTNWMGKYETEDIIDGLDWLQEHTGGAVDLGRVGIYGGSYGGFMALYAASVAPDRFHAAAALRKVTNWRNYYYANPWYTLPRLGDPEKVPEHYDRSSPLTYAADIQAPVLLLHGLIDDNVGFQDAMQYTDALIRNGNSAFDLMVYPTERHGFTQPNSWLDEYTRIFNFFEENLK